MAIEVELVAPLTATVGAKSDLRAHQRKLAMFTPLGVDLADIRSSSQVYVLANAPNSGDACTLLGPPNLVKVIAGEAIKLGDYTQPMSASGLIGVTSVGNAGRFGLAWGTAAGSGALVPVHVGM